MSSSSSDENPAKVYHISPEKKRLYQSKFREKNPDYWKEYYLKNRDSYYVKEHCDVCGMDYERSHVKRHIKTRFHQKALKEKEGQNSPNRE